MAIKTIITRGYGNGTFNGTIPLVVKRGFAAPATPFVLQRDVLMAVGVLADVPGLAVLANVATLPDTITGTELATALFAGVILEPIASAAILADAVNNPEMATVILADTITGTELATAILPDAISGPKTAVAEVA